MKSYFLILGIFILAIACESNPKNPKEPAPDPALVEQMKQESLVDSTNWTTIQWLDSTQQFGKVVEGEKVMVTFHFKNTGTKPLLIASVQASCGCTVPSKPEEPVVPGAEGVIKAEFNSEGRVGMANKTITVRCNTAVREYVLKFEGEVLAKK